ncbi:hypothetical protein Tco_1119196 [Tanacetum coccineum]|uniref:Retroviral polymerase SH3-like domain-containing protein n=1 Tax=Tanacetum coccineum TaxID=301880 RepID=A0ABQ5DQ70_9ASTR
MGITSGIKGYCLWCSETKKMNFSRVVIFNESDMLKKVNAKQLDETPKREPQHQQHESIATSKIRRNVKRPTRLNDTVACASSIAADDVPTTYFKVTRGSKEEKWRTTIAKK